MSAKKTIKYEDLVDMLSHYSTSLGDKGRKSFLQKNEQFCLKTANGPVFDYNAYICRLESKIAQFGLEKHIIIEDDRKIFTFATSCEHHTKLITVKNLIIQIDSNNSTLALQFDSSEIVLGAFKYIIGLHITFVNNEFMVTDTEPDNQVWFSLSDHAYISFISNTFNDVNVAAYGSTKEGYILEFKDNIFNNRRVNIDASSSHFVIDEEDHKYINFDVKGAAIYGWKQVKRLEQDAINTKSFKRLAALNKRAEEGGDIYLRDIATMLFNMHNWVRGEIR